MIVNLYSDGTKFGQVAGGAISAKGVKNPHGNFKLRYLTGLDREVQVQVMRSDAARALVDRVVAHAIANGEATVYCHGGRHRSVAIVEVAGCRLESMGHDVRILHLRKDTW